MAGVDVRVVPVICGPTGAGKSALAMALAARIPSTIIVADSSGRTGVEYFALRNEDIRFSTHHDSLLLPSNR